MKRRDFFEGHWGPYLLRAAALPVSYGCAGGWMVDEGRGRWAWAGVLMWSVKQRPNPTQPNPKQPPPLYPNQPNPFQSSPNPTQPHRNPQTTSPPPQRAHQRCRGGGAAAGGGGARHSSRHRPHPQPDAAHARHRCARVCRCTPCLFRAAHCVRARLGRISIFPAAKWIGQPMTHPHALFLPHPTLLSPVVFGYLMASAKEARVDVPEW